MNITNMNITKKTYDSSGSFIQIKSKFKKAFLKVFLSAMFGLLGGRDSLAGHEVGNGGDALLCHKKEVKLLDYEEAKREGRFSIDWTKLSKELKLEKEFEKSKDPFVLSEKILERLKVFDPNLFDIYARALKQIKGQIRFEAQSKLRNIQDSLEISLPKGCELLQLAIRRDDPLTRESLISIDQDLWEKMDPFHQAGLVLHEIIYEHFMNLGEKNSIKVRLFNAWLASEGMPKMTNVQYREFIKELRIAYYPK